MNHWTKLSPEQAQTLYGIQAHLAIDPDNRFYAGSLRPDNEPLDGPYMLIALLKHKNTGVGTVHVVKLIPEYFEELVGFDPLDPGAAGGFISGISITAEEMRELSQILVDFSQSLTSLYPDEQVFTLIDEVDLPFHRFKFSNDDSYCTFYHQRLDTLHSEQFDEETTFLRIVRAKDARDKQLGFSIERFQKRDLPKVKPSYLDVVHKSQGQTTLDKVGFIQLAQILQQYVDNLNQ